MKLFILLYMALIVERSTSSTARLDIVHLHPKDIQNTTTTRILTPSSYPSTTIAAATTISTPSSAVWSHPGHADIGTPVAPFHFYNDNNGDGTYRYGFETENHIIRRESGYLKNIGNKDHESSVVEGCFSFIAPNGVTYIVNYVADENGFRTFGDHLPTTPRPISVTLLKTLQYTKDTTEIRNIQPEKPFLGLQPPYVTLKKVHYDYTVM